MGTQAKCKICGHTFTTSNQFRHYCSIECQSIGRYRNTYNGNKRRLTEKIKCGVCGVEFLGEEGQQFCSVQCRLAGMRAREYHLICIRCGKEFVSSKNYAKCCSNRCRESVRAKKKRQAIKEAAIAKRQSAKEQEKKQTEKHTVSAVSSTVIPDKTGLSYGKRRAAEYLAKLPKIEV